MDLSQSIHLSSSDVVHALFGFFSLPAVNAVIALLLALMLVTVTIPRMVRLVRYYGLGDRSVYYDDPVQGWGRGEYNDERFDAPWAVGGHGLDSWQGDEGRVTFGTPETGIDLFEYYPSTLAEKIEAGVVDPDDAWDYSPETGITYK